MKKTLFTLMCLLPFSISAEKMSFSTMTYNVRYGLASDRENAWELRKDVVENSVRAFDPDFIGGQEFYPFQVDYFDLKFPAFNSYGIPRADGLPSTGGMDEATTIFYREKEFYPVQLGTFWLSENPEEWASKSWDTAISRTVTWGEFFHRPTGEHLFIFNTHFDHAGSQARLNSAKLMVEKIDEIAGKKAPVVVLGDFNAVAEKSEPWRVFAEADFKDAWVESPEKKGPASTWSRFQAPDENSDRRIDWILFRGPLKVSFVETVTYQEEGRYPSDHYPVYADFELIEKVEEVNSQD